MGKSTTLEQPHLEQLTTNSSERAGGRSERICVHNYRAIEPRVQYVLECRQRPQSQSRCVAEQNLHALSHNLRRQVFVSFSSHVQHERFRVCEALLTVRHNAMNVPDRINLPSVGARANYVLSKACPFPSSRSGSRFPRPSRHRRVLPVDQGRHLESETTSTTTPHPLSADLLQGTGPSYS